ncbi:hypothetical protein ACROYT_G027458 [Oculina patagonica]
MTTIRGEDEEEGTVISRWARRKVGSQFKDEYLDGRKSFIFSWNKEHREIHEEALLHFFDPSKKGQKFEYQPKPKPVPKPKTEEPEITPAADRDIQPEPYVVEDDREQLVPDDESSGARRRSFSDREEQKQGLRGQQEGASYGTIGPGEAERDYPAGTVLLETRMRYGKISYQAKDIVKREDRWQPPDQVETELLERYMSRLLSLE